MYLRGGLFWRPPEFSAKVFGAGPAQSRFIIIRIVEGAEKGAGAIGRPPTIASGGVDRHKCET